MLVLRAEALQPLFNKCWPETNWAHDLNRKRATLHESAKDTWSTYKTDKRALSPGIGTMPLIEESGRNLQGGKAHKRCVWCDCKGMINSLSTKNVTK